MNEELNLIEQVAAGLRAMGQDAKNVHSLACTSEGLPFPIESVCGIPVTIIPSTILPGEESVGCEILLVPIFKCGTKSTLVLNQKYVDAYWDATEGGQP